MLNNMTQKKIFMETYGCTDFSKNLIETYGWPISLKNLNETYGCTDFSKNFIEISATICFSESEIKR